MTRTLTIAIALLICLSGFLRLGGTLSSSPPACTITSVTLSPTTFTAPFNGTVGTLATNPAGGSCTSPTYTIAGTNASDFTVSGSSLNTNGSLNAGTYNITITSTISGADNSPYTSPPGNGFSGTITGTSGELTLTRTFYNPTGSNTPSTAFWSIGQPFNSSAWLSGTGTTLSGTDDVPAGYALAATLGGSAVNIACGEPKFAADGSLAWCHLLVDFAGNTISAGSNAVLELSATSSASSISVSSLSCSSGTVSVTTASAHGLSSGNWVYMGGQSPSWYQGPQQITVTGSTTFTYSLLNGCGAGSVVTKGTEIPEVVANYAASGITNSAWEALGDQVQLTSITALPTATQNGNATINNGSGSAGTTLTIPCCAGNLNGSVQLGATVTGSGVSSGTVITARGSGEGSTGTYTVNNSQLVAAENLTFTPNANDEIGSGTWNAMFDGGPENSITTLISSPRGLEVKVITPFVDNTTYSVASTSYAGGTLTVNTSSAHGLFTGDQVELFDGATPVAYCSAASGGITVVGSYPTSTQFTCSLGSNPGTITAESPAHRNIFAAMYYICYETSVGGSGPCASEGPFVENGWVRLSLGTYNEMQSTTQYNYSLAFSRGGSVVRSYANLQDASYHGNIVSRADGQWDWSADDPSIWVGQNYTNVVATGKVPPFAPGISGYNNGLGLYATVESLSGATITLDTVGHLYSASNLTDQKNQSWVAAVQETGLAGLSTSTVYWACPVTTTTVKLYDNQGDALACSSTGLETPSGATSAQLYDVAAPGLVWQAYMHQESTGPRPDISMTSEWGAGYLVGNTQAWQTSGRLAALMMASYSPWRVLEASTQKIPSLLLSGNTPSGMGSSYSTTSWVPNGNPSAGINAGEGFPTQANGFNGWGVVSDHAPSPAYVTWLMEGLPYLRDVMLSHADAMIDFVVEDEKYTISFPSGEGNRSYTGVVICNWPGPDIRGGAWTARDIGYAMMMALQNSPEWWYLNNVLTLNMAECADQEAFMGAQYQANGMVYQDWNFATSSDHNLADATMQSQEIQMFMQGYFVEAIPFDAVLLGDYIPGLVTQADFSGNWATATYTTYSAEGGQCYFYATAYAASPGKSAQGASEPSSWAALTDFGVGGAAGAQVNMSSGSSAITYTTQPYWTIAVGDLVRPVNYESDGASGFAAPANPVPTGFTAGQDYYVLSVTGSPPTITLGTSLSGPAISPSGTVTNPINVFNVPAGQANCPPAGTSGTISGGLAPDSYFTYDTSGLAIMSELGVTNASLAYADSTYVFAFPYSGGAQSCDTTARFCMAPP